MIRVSVIIPTILRESLNAAVESVLSQSLDPGQFEVIVVNDSGDEIKNLSWLSSPNVKTLNTMRRERSVARNTGASISRGEYLLFLDDDDWLLPGGLITLLALSEQTEADMLVGGTIMMDRTGRICSSTKECSGNNPG